MKTIIFSTALSLAFLTSCKKEDVNGNASTFTYQLKTINRSSVVGKTGVTSRTEGASINWTAGNASTSELKFEAEGSNGEVEFKQKMAQQVDLFAATSVLGNLTVSAGTYKEVDFKATLVPAGNTPSLALEGSFTSGGVTKQVKFIASSALELKAEKKNVTVSQGQVYSALTSIDLSQLANGLTEAALNNADLTNGVIVLSASSNSNLYNILLNNLNNHHGEAEIEHHG